MFRPVKVLLVPNSLVQGHEHLKTGLLHERE